MELERHRLLQPATTIASRRASRFHGSLALQRTLLAVAPVAALRSTSAGAPTSSASPANSERSPPLNCNEPYSRAITVRRPILHRRIELRTRSPPYERPEARSFLRRGGMPIRDTMQVRVAVGAVVLTALLDTGSTHNFISESARAQPPFRLANQRSPPPSPGTDRLPGVIRQAPITIAGEAFNVDLYVMPLAGYDLVLGTQCW